MHHFFTQLLLGASVVAGLPAPAAAGTFTHVATMAQPVTGVLAADSAANLYTEIATVSPAVGSVVLLKAASGYSVRRTLYSFPTGGNLGRFPLGGVTLKQGTVLGVTEEGGTMGGGAIFDLGKPSDVVPTTLHEFYYSAEFDGFNPQSGLTAGPTDLLYGTTTIDPRQSPYNDGSVFEVGIDPLNPVYSAIHIFGSRSGDGLQPTTGRLAADGGNSLVGLTVHGGYYGNGTDGGGTVFRVLLVNGAWQEHVIISFNDVAGQLFPSKGSNMAVDAAGNLFACLAGGIYGLGGIIELSPPATSNGVWHGKTVVEFGARLYDPYVLSSCAITLDPATGTIVGVADQGGRRNVGALFTAAPPSGSGNNKWSEQVVHSFAGDERDGSKPMAAPVKVGSTYYGSAGTVIWGYTP